jgi:hypothetical protein
MKNALMASAASRLPVVMFPAALTSAGGSAAGALPSASFASCHSTLGSLLDLARVSALLARLSRFTRLFAAFLRAWYLGVPALTESRRSIILRVSLVR